jgi:hypothetical protein
LSPVSDRLEACFSAKLYGQRSQQSPLIKGVRGLLKKKVKELIEKEKATGGFFTLCALDSSKRQLMEADMSTTHKQADNHHGEGSKNNQGKNK